MLKWRSRIYARETGIQHRNGLAFAVKTFVVEFGGANHFGLSVSNSVLAPVGGNAKVGSWFIRKFFTFLIRFGPVYGGNIFHERQGIYLRQFRRITENYGAV